MHEDIRVTLRAKGYIRQPDGSYSKVASGLARPCRELQKQAESSASRSDLHRKESQATNGRDHRKLPRTVSLTFHVSDRRHRDVDGMTSTIMDCLVRAGAIPDDNRFEVGRIEAEAVDCQTGQERVEVEIERSTLAKDRL
jgi:Holliday junction resolvase RusA-like endonuclease